jgi:hypothetical protein
MGRLFPAAALALALLFVAAPVSPMGENPAVAQRSPTVAPASPHYMFSRHYLYQRWDYWSNHLIYVHHLDIYGNVVSIETRPW